jgi:hypothetical protein
MSHVGACRGQFVSEEPGAVVVISGARAVDRELEQRNRVGGAPERAQAAGDAIPGIFELPAIASIALTYGECGLEACE